MKNSSIKIITPYIIAYIVILKKKKIVIYNLHFYLLTSMYKQSFCPLFLYNVAVYKGIVKLTVIMKMKMLKNAKLPDVKGCTRD